MNVGPAAGTVDPVAVVTRVVRLLITVLELLLLFRFFFKFAGANAIQPLIAALYGFTEPLVRPFQGIFPEPRTPAVVIDVPALLAIVFLFLVAGSSSRSSGRSQAGPSSEDEAAAADRCRREGRLGVGGPSPRTGIRIVTRRPDPPLVFERRR